MCPRMTQNMLMTRSPFKQVITPGACLVANKVGTVLYKEKAVINSYYCIELALITVTVCFTRRRDLSVEAVVDIYSHC